MKKSYDDYYDRVMTLLSEDGYDPELAVYDDCIEDADAGMTPEETAGRIEFAEKMRKRNGGEV